MRQQLAVWSGVVAMALALPAARAQEEKHGMDINERPRISVSGQGRVSAAPDQAVVNVGVVTQAPAAKDALAANTEAMTGLLDIVKQQGVAQKDVQTTNINIQPQYSQPPQPLPGRQPQEFVPKIVSYQVINTVELTVRDIKSLGAVLDAVVVAGANQMYGISFRFDDPAKLLDQARKQAVADAKRKAQQLADEAGVVLGPPLLISEGGVAPPMPQPMMRAGRMLAMAADRAPVPVAAGEQELTVDVSVVYELRYPAK